jgi:hypothetical protein
VGKNDPGRWINISKVSRKMRREHKAGGKQGCPEGRNRVFYGANGKETD